MLCKKKTAVSFIAIEPMQWHSEEYRKQGSPPTTEPGSNFEAKQIRAHFKRNTSQIVDGKFDCLIYSLQDRR